MCLLFSVFSLLVLSQLFGIPPNFWGLSQFVLPLFLGLFLQGTFPQGFGAQSGPFGNLGLPYLPSSDLSRCCCDLSVTEQKAKADMSLHVSSLQVAKSSQGREPSDQQATKCHLIPAAKPVNYASGLHHVSSPLSGPVFRLGSEELWWGKEELLVIR